MSYSFKLPLNGQILCMWGRILLKLTQYADDSIVHLLIYPIDPSNCHVLQHDHYEQRQSSRVIVEHGHKVVSWALNKQETNGEGQQAASHCRRGEGCKLLCIMINMF